MKSIFDHFWRAIMEVNKTKFLWMAEVWLSVLFRKLSLKFWDLFERKHDMKHWSRSIKQVNLFKQFINSRNKEKDWTMKTFLAFSLQQVIEIAQIHPTLQCPSEWVWYSGIKINANLNWKHIYMILQ